VNRRIALVVVISLIVASAVSVAVAQQTANRYYYLALDYYEIGTSTSSPSMVGYGGLGFVDLIAFRVGTTHYLLNTTSNSYYSANLVFDNGNKDTGVWYCNGVNWGLWLTGQDITNNYKVRFYSKDLTTKYVEEYATFAYYFSGIGNNYVVFSSSTNGAYSFGLEVYILSCTSTSLSETRYSPSVNPPSSYQYTYGRVITIGNSSSKVLVVGVVRDSSSNVAVAYGIANNLGSSSVSLGTVALTLGSSYAILLYGYETSNAFIFGAVTSSNLYIVNVSKSSGSYTTTTYPGDYGSISSSSDLGRIGWLVPDSNGNPIYAIFDNPLRIYNIPNRFFITASNFNSGTGFVGTYRRDIALPALAQRSGVYGYGFLKLKVAEVTTTLTVLSTIYNTLTTSITQTLTNTVTQTETLTETLTNTVTQTETLTRTVTNVIPVPYEVTKTVTVTVTTFGWVGFASGFSAIGVALVVLVIVFVALVLALSLSKR
jgi:hypothetical protein